MIHFRIEYQHSQNKAIIKYRTFSINKLILIHSHQSGYSRWSIHLLYMLNIVVVKDEFFSGDTPYMVN